MRMWFRFFIIYCPLSGPPGRTGVSVLLCVNACGRGSQHVFHGGLRVSRCLVNVKSSRARLPAAPARVAVGVAPHQPSPRRDARTKVCASVVQVRVTCGRLYDTVESSKGPRKRTRNPTPRDNSRSYSDRAERVSVCGVL